MTFCDFDPICIFLTIDFCENLHEYFFVWNQFLIMKTIRKNAKIFYKFNILAKVVTHTKEMKKNAKILNLWNVLAFFLIVFMIKIWFQTKKHSCNFSQKSIVIKIQIGSKSQFFFANYLPVTQKQRLKSKNFHEWNPPKMTQIVIENHKNHYLFFHSINKNSTGPGAASHEYIFPFFSVLLETW